VTVRDGPASEGPTSVGLADRTAFVEGTGDNERSLPRPPSTNANLARGAIARGLPVLEQTEGDRLRIWCCAEALELALQSPPCNLSGAGEFDLPRALFEFVDIDGCCENTPFECVDSERGCIVIGIGKRLLIFTIEDYILSRFTMSLCSC